MSWLTLHLASGAGFFSGTVCVLAAIVLASARRRVLRGLGWVLASAGALLVTLSATPLPAWAYAVWGAAVLAAMLASTARPRRRPAIVLALVGAAVTVGVAIAEARHHVVPKVPPVAQRRLYVVGDSLSAGVEAGGGRTWPEILRVERDVPVRNLSRAGANVGSTVRALGIRPPFSAGLVVVELGGNDQFGRTPLPEFEAKLAELLRRLVHPDRVVVMFELPLLPFNNGYGRVQRRLAAEHGVVLVPRRVLVDLVSPEGATTDGIHLTAAGHREMAERVWAMIGPALPSP